MKKYCIKTLVLSVCSAGVLFNSVVVAQDIPAPSSELSQLYLKAQNHPSVAYAADQLSVAKTELDGAQWGYYPSLSVDGTSPVDDSSQLSFSVEQPLYTAGRVGASVASATHGVDIAVQQVDETLLNVKLQIAIAYADLLRADYRAEVANANIEELRLLHEVISRRVEQQITPRAEQTLVFARLQQARSELFQIDGLREQAKNRIQTATGESLSKAQKLSCNLPAQMSEARLYESALDFSPAMDRLGSSRQQANADVSVAQANQWPKLVLGAQHVTDSSFNGDSDSSLFFGFRYQLQDGLSVRSQIGTAKAMLSAVNSSERLFIEELRQQVASLVRDYQAADNQLEPLQNLVASNQDLIDSYLRQYRAGKKSWLDVVNAQREKAQAEFMLSDVKAQRCSTVAQLGLLVGKDFTSFN